MDRWQMCSRWCSSNLPHSKDDRLCNRLHERAWFAHTLHDGQPCSIQWSSLSAIWCRWYAWWYSSSQFTQSKSAQSMFLWTFFVTQSSLSTWRFKCASWQMCTLASSTRSAAAEMRLWCTQFFWFAMFACAGYHRANAQRCRIICEWLVQPNQYIASYNGCNPPQKLPPLNRWVDTVIHRKQMSPEQLAALSMIAPYDIKLKRGKPRTKRFRNKLERGGKRAGASRKKRPRDTLTDLPNTDLPNSDVESGRPTKVRKKNQCSNCKSFEHTASHCDKKLKCKRCDAEHISRNCPHRAKRMKKAAVVSKWLQRWFQSINHVAVDQRCLTGWQSVCFMWIEWLFH